MKSEPKLCINCKYYFNEFVDDAERWGKCNRQSKVTKSLITGDNTITRNWVLCCYERQNRFFRCGPKAKYFQPKI